MHVAHFEARTLARQAARAERRDAALVRHFRQRVVLVHELRQLRGAEELLHRGRDRLGVDHFLRHQAFGLSASVRRSLTARSTRTRPMRKAFSAISPTAAHAAVAEVVDVVDLAVAVADVASASLHARR